MTLQTMSLYGDPAEVAQFVGCTPEWLAKQRVAGTGPRFAKVGRKVRYRWADVQAWLDANTFERTADR